MHYENEVAPEIHMLGMMGGGRRGAGDASRGGSDGGHHGSANEEYDDFGGRVSGPVRADRSRERRTGAGRFGLLNIPEPVSGADTNLNRGVSLAEFQTASTQRFILLDTNHDGKLELGELEERLPARRR
jgi:hypothetical protein